MEEILIGGMPPDQYLIEVVRPKLISLENTLIFNLLERAQYATNDVVYLPGGLKVKGFEGSFFDFMLKGTEETHARAGRFDHAEELPFSEDLPECIVTRASENIPIKRTGLNLNPDIREAYFEIMRNICEPGDDTHYGSAVELDIRCLQVLSHRIHIGEEVAETKFCKYPEKYQRLIAEGDTKEITKKLTNQKVEDLIQERVFRRTIDYQTEDILGNGEVAVQIFKDLIASQKEGRVEIGPLKKGGQDKKVQAHRRLVNPEIIRDFYRDKVIPLTKIIEIDYFMNRPIEDQKD